MSSDFEIFEQHQQNIHKMAEGMPDALPFSVREAMAELKVMDVNSWRRVPESHFVHSILPALTGELGDAIDFRWWAFRFGSQFKGFYIVDDNDTSKLIFEVPPLMNSHFTTRKAKNARDTVGEARANYKNRVYSRPGDARQEMLENLQGRMDFTGIHSSLIESMQKLDKIFIHYGKPSIFEKAQSAELKKLMGVKDNSAPAASAEESQVYKDEDYSDAGMLD